MQQYNANLPGVSANPDHAAFTRVELLVVLSVVALMGILLLPTLAATQTKSSESVCRDNLRQLILAWQLYAGQNQDRLVMNFHGGEAQGGNAGTVAQNAPWTVGWLDWTLAPDNTNTLFLTQDRYSRLATFLGHSAEVFKCPSDRYLSATQRARGWKSRVRSYAVNLVVGGGNAESGPWEPIYRHAIKTSDLLIPGPAQTYVYAEEHPDSINDPGLFNPRQTAWVDQPATYHNGAAAFAFADGHLELHKWQASLVQPRAARVKYINALDARSYAGDPDLHWVSYRANRVSEKSY
ncbi:MAG: prepilin-type cleavage/methylation domain-containing protein [Verrucomicrobiota bacterium]